MKDFSGFPSPGWPASAAGSLPENLHLCMWSWKYTNTQVIKDIIKRKLLIIVNLKCSVFTALQRTWMSSRYILSKPAFLIITPSLVSHLYILRSVSLTDIISTTGGILTSLLKGFLVKLFLTDSRPRSATMTLKEEDDWGRKMTGALKWTFRAIRVLRSASSFTPDAAFSAAWTVTSARASLASWKLLMNAWEQERMENSRV